MPLEVFSFNAAEFEADGRNVTALCAPFNALPGDGRKVSFLPGAFTNTIQGKRQSQVPFFGLHPASGDTMPVGRSTRLEQTADGLVGSFHISQTPAGDETLTLIKNGVLHSVSVGVSVLRARKVEGGGLEFQDVKLAHVAGVPDPAFDEAEVLDVHSSAENAVTGMSLEVARARLQVIRNRNFYTG